MNSFVISIGSNTKDREWQMKYGIEWLKHNFSVNRTSSIYNSVAINGRDSDYLNAVMSACTKKSLDETSALLEQYETVCGRTPASKLEGCVPMDIDIVIWNGELLRQRDFGQQYFQRGWQELKDADINI